MKVIVLFLVTALEASKRRILALTLPALPSHSTETERVLYFSSLLPLDSFCVVRDFVLLRSLWLIIEIFYSTSAAVSTVHFAIAVHIGSNYQYTIRGGGRGNNKL